ncbi:NPC intracellular cholesterol transporter 2 homolog a [Sabethes cyaneus]|uniref:NPC intracellular cholesterol transporter 2 homolog a n=1 Tax=Sabethes cyaneus TaxID=53552 RepID=UPI00237D812C|nr:NPC intracellular cholesterol transporter 2 homolog a [Sabethes cyaneus]
MRWIAGIICAALLTTSSAMFLATREPWFKAKQPAPRTGLPIEDCGLMHDIISVQLSSCSSIPCTLQRGTDVTVVVEFSANGASSLPSMKHEVYFILNFVKTKATIMPDTCDGIYCPLHVDNGLRFTATMHVSSSLPALRGTLHWELLNESKQAVLCYKLLISIN